MYRILVNNALFCDSRIDDLAIVDPVVTLEVNSAGSFEFTIPHGHPKAELISGRTDIVTVERDGEIIIKAVPIETTEDFYGNIKVVCEGELTYLNDSILRQSHKQGLTVRQLLESYINEHNSQVEESKRFTVGSVTVSDDYITCYTNYNSTMQEIKEDLLDDLGGYLRVRYSGTTKYLDYLAESPHTSDQIIELGKNLMDYESNLDSTEIATIIIPLGATQETQEVSGLDAYLTIKSVNDGKDYLESTTAAQYFGWITQVVHWDNVTTASALKSKGQAYLNDIQFDNVVLELSAVDFGALSDDIDSFHVLDKIRVVSAPHGMDKWFVLTKQTINLNNPENDRITLGKTEKKSLSTKVIQQNEEILKRIEQVPTSSAVKSAIDNATNLLRGAEGGHVKIVTNADGKPDAILIMDTDDEETATKIWRWNLNGFGYSSDGGETYGLAMTMDGVIVADYIKTGNLLADNGKYELNLETGKVKMKDAEITGGSINIQTASETADAIALNYVDSAGNLSSTFMNSTGLQSTYRQSYGISHSKMYGSYLALWEDRTDGVENRSVSMFPWEIALGKSINGFSDGKYVLLSDTNGGQVTIGGSASLNYGAWDPCGWGYQYGKLAINQGIVSSGRIHSLEGYTFMGDKGYYAQSTTSYRLTVNGAIYCIGLQNVSDRNMKDNITDLDDSLIEVFDAISPKQFTFKAEDDGRVHYGYIAQDIEEALEDAGIDSTKCNMFRINKRVNEDGESEEVRSLSYDDVFMMYDLKIRQLEKRIAELENRLEETNE